MKAAGNRFSKASALAALWRWSGSPAPPGLSQRRGRRSRRRRRRKARLHEEGGRGAGGSADRADQAGRLPPKEQEADRPDHHRRGVRRPAAGRRSSKLNQVTIEQYQRLLRVTDDDDPQKADFHFRIAELYAEQQRYYNFQARALDQKIFEAKARRASRACRREQKQLRGARSASGCCKAVESYVAAVAVPQVRPHGRGAVQAGLPAADHQEGGPGARVLPPPDQGLPELEVRARRLPVVRPVLLRQGRDGSGQEVLREGRAVPQVAGLRLRRLQEGLVLHQPGRLQDRPGDLRRRHPAGPGGQGRRQQAGATRRSSARPRRTWSRPTPARPAPAPTRPGSSSAAWAATSPPR